jgi:subtilisin family serine protease
MLDELWSSVPFARGDLAHRPPIDEDGSFAIVAIIDDGIDLLHHCFLDAMGDTRIEAVWDQTDSAGPSPAACGFPAELSFGTLHTKGDIARYVATNVVPPGLGRNTGTPSNPSGHGTHVTSIAAGRCCGLFSGGMAPGARIVVVRPTTKVGHGDPLSVGYSVSHVAALSFIDHVADELDLPVAVNVSLGMNAGAHDGSSLLEAAFDGFSNGGRKPGRVIIKSAGNERGQDSHASLTMSSGMLDKLTWASHGPHVGPDNIEAWFHSSDDLRFRLIVPSEQATPWVDCSAPSTSGTLASGERYDLTLDRYFRDNGDTRLLITLNATLGSSIPAGTFVLEVHSRSVVSAGRVDAWIELVSKRPIRFVTNLDDEITLSIPGTARTVVSVASVGASLPLVSSAFSSKGPSRDDRRKPDISAPGDKITAAQSGTANGTITMSGTSMAAPHVTGAVALMFSHRARARLSIPNAMQVGAALRGTTQNFNGRHTPAVGYGVLDAQALIKTFQ